MGILRWDSNCDNFDKSNLFQWRPDWHNNNWSVRKSSILLPRYCQLKTLKVFKILKLYSKVKKVTQTKCWILQMKSFLGEPRLPKISLASRHMSLWVPGLQAQNVFKAERQESIKWFQVGAEGCWAPWRKCWKYCTLPVVQVGFHLHISFYLILFLILTFTSHSLCCWGFQIYPFLWPLTSVQGWLRKTSPSRSIDLAGQQRWGWSGANSQKNPSMDLYSPSNKLWSTQHMLEHDE